MPVVLIEIAPANAPPDLSRALVGACSSAIREGTCTLAADSRGATSAKTAVAIVRFTDARERRAEIQVGARHDGSPTWRERTLEFNDSDERIERWRAAGLTIATLADEVVPAEPLPPLTAGADAAPTTPPGSSSVESVPKAASPPSNGATAPAESQAAPASPHDAAKDDATRTRHPRSSARHGGAWLDLSGFGGPGLTSGPWRIGGGASVGWRPGAPPIFVGAEFSYALRPKSADLQATWATGEARIGTVLGADAEKGFSVEPMAGVSVDHLRVTVDPHDTPGTTSGSTTTFGLRLGVDALWNVGLLSPFVGIRAWHNLTATAVRVRDEDSGTSSANGWLLGLGLRWRLQ